jgi:hypothetical protein
LYRLDEWIANRSVPSGRDLSTLLVRSVILGPTGGGSEDALTQLSVGVVRIGSIRHSQQKCVGSIGKVFASIAATIVLEGIKRAKGGDTPGTIVRVGDGS